MTKNGATSGDLIDGDVVRDAAIALLQAAPGEWQTVTFEMEYFSVGMASYECRVVKSDGDVTEIEVPARTRRAFRDIRLRQMDIGQDAFTVAILTVTASAKVDGEATFALDLDYREPRYEPA